VERPKAQRPRLDLGTIGRIILKLIVKKQDGKHRVDLSGSGEGQVTGTCE
jgi:hypothetical protein